MTAFETAWNRSFGVRRPERIVCVGRNYAAHADEEGADLPAAPLLFAKLANTVVGPGDAIELPAESSHVDAEAELALVIARAARRVAPERAAGAAGYTAANDVSARDFQFADGQWFRGKGYDTFCPIQPEVVPLETLEPEVPVRQAVNGTVLQDGNTRDLVRARDARRLRLQRRHARARGRDPHGDAGRVGYFRDPPVALRPGDVVEVTVGGVAPLQNPVVAA